MRLTRHDTYRWWEVKSERTNDSWGRVFSLGGALETALRANRQQIEIWECEGTSSYVSTMILVVERVGETFVVKEP